jgi:hypothetical protein
MKSLRTADGQVFRANGRHLLRNAAATLALLNAAEPMLAVDPGSAIRPGQIALANTDRFTEAFFDEPLTTYAVGYRDPNNIAETLEFFAPETQAPNRFTYKTQTNAEEFYSETVEDIRAIGGVFKRVEYTGGEVEARTHNKGLVTRVDLTNEAPGWEQRKTAKLLRRLWRNELRRAIALLSAAATNTAKTWDVTAGKDPDQDVLTDLVTAATASGVGVNRIGYGHTAWSKRALSHRAQNTAGGFASATMTPEQLAAILMVDKVLVSRERYQSSASAKSEIVSNLVLMFNAIGGADLEDASNIKRFVSPCVGGGRTRVYVQQVSPHLVDLSVEHNSLIAITSTLGIRQFTIS